MRDVITGTVCVVLGVILLAGLIPAGISVPGRLPNLAMSPAFWPRVLAVALLLGGAVLALQGVLARRGGARQTAEAVSAEPTLWAGWVRLGAAIGLLFPYYLACLEFGLLMPSVAAFIVYALLAGERRYLLVAAGGVLMPLALTIFFIYVANVLIPLGPLWWLM